METMVIVVIQTKDNILYAGILLATALLCACSQAGSERRRKQEDDSAIAGNATYGRGCRHGRIAGRLPG